MVPLITTHHQRKRFLRPRGRVNVWRLVRRHQLLEVLALTGGIALVWLGAEWDNDQRAAWIGLQAVHLQSADADLTIGVPVGAHRGSRQSL